MDDIISRVYFRISAVLLLITGALKLLSLAGGARILESPDPVFGAPYRDLMLLEAALEVVTGVLLLTRIGRKHGLLILFWLGLMFCGYHFAVFLLDPAAPCPCLGTLWGSFGVKQELMDRAARAVAVSFVVGPVLIWLRGWAGKRAQKGPAAAADRA